METNTEDSPDEPSLRDSPTASGRKGQRAWVEEIPDDDDIGRFVEKYPAVVASVVGQGSTLFERWKQENEEEKRGCYSPFEDRDEWEMAKWIALNMGSNQVEEFLKLAMIKNNCHMSAGSKYSFFKQIDSLPTCSPWFCDEITVVGDRIGENGNFMQENVELWRRDPVECVRELIGNPAFSEVMKYEPERVYTDAQKTSQRYDEMSSANWWWNVQGDLPTGATIAPIILASDQTQLSQFRGDQKAWPVYMSIGNIAKSVRRQVTARATMLIGYLPTTKLECFSDETRSLAGYRLYHHAMRSLLQPLKDAGTSGVEMVCADGFIRHVFPILAAYVADHPEQCLITCVKENHCPRGTVDPKNRGDAMDLDDCPLRNVSETLKILKTHRDGAPCPRFASDGLRPVYEPFWADLPHCNVFACITPDILHQLHKGVFKDHLVKWCTQLVGEEEIDRRFQAMSDIPGLRYFKKGISTISQWTGSEHKEMQKVFVALLSGAVEPRVLAVAQSVVDFIYYAQFQVHTTSSLHALRSAFKTFHANKNVFLDTNVRTHFNIPKLHSMLHYLDALEELGTADGYSTELPERLHINFAKVAYRGGNRKDYIAHMTRWLQRREAIEVRSHFLRWSAAQELAFHQRSGAESPDMVGDDGDMREGKDTDEELEVCTYPSALATHSSLAGFRSTAFSLAGGFRVAKRPSYVSLDLTQLQESFGATQFLPALTAFVQKQLGPQAQMPSLRDKYNVFKQIKVKIAKNTYVSSSCSYDKLRASPPITKKDPRHPLQLAHFDTALIVEDPDLFAENSQRGII